MKESKSYENEKVFSSNGSGIYDKQQWQQGCGSSEEEGKIETNEKTEASGETDTSFDSANDIL